MKGFVSKLVPSISSVPLFKNIRYGTLHACGSTYASIMTRPHVTVNNKFAPHKANLNLEWSPLSSVSFPREITWLAGAPGAGKGTNSTHIAKARGYEAPTIVMSSLLESPECKRIKDAGGMVDDTTVQNALLAELAKPEYRRGVVVDGFPRTEKQAEWLNSVYDTLAFPTKFNFVMLFIEEEASIQRQLSRGESIRSLNLVRSAGGLPPLEERATDVSEEAARIRYQNFITQYEAINKLGSRYSLSIVDASAPIDTVRQRLTAALTSTTTRTTTTRRKQQQHQFISSLNNTVSASINNSSKVAYL